MGLFGHDDDKKDDQAMGSDQSMAGGMPADNSAMGAGGGMPSTPAGDAGAAGHGHQRRR